MRARLASWRGRRYRGTRRRHGLERATVPFGRQLFAVDQLSAPLVALVALLHFLTALATGRTKERRFSRSWSLPAWRFAWPSSAARNRGCSSPAGRRNRAGLPGAANRRKPTRVYVCTLTVCVGLLVLGWALPIRAWGAGRRTAWRRSRAGGHPHPLRTVPPLLGDRLVRARLVRQRPAVRDPADRRLRGHPPGPAGRPDWVLSGSACSRWRRPCTPRRWRWSSRDAPLLRLPLPQPCVVGPGRAGAAHRHQPDGRAVPCGFRSPCRWRARLILRALEARVGRLSLELPRPVRQLADAGGVLRADGLASVGFPGTLGFLATDLVRGRVLDASPWVGLGVVAAAR